MNPFKRKQKTKDVTSDKGDQSSRSLVAESTATTASSTNLKDAEAEGQASARSAPHAKGEQPDDVLERLQEVLDRFEITIAEANDLVILRDYEMVVICDDSGSMNNAAEPSHVRARNTKKRTRWDELQDTVSEIVEIASCFDENGIDIYFLNRRPHALGVTHTSDPKFAQAFESKPAGTTPLADTLQDVAQKTTGERKVLMFILTDGEPDGGKEEFIPIVEQVVAKGDVHIQIMACTHEEEEVAWLNALDSKIKQVDVCDDFYAERKEVLASGLKKKFTRGDWCMKAMLAPVSHKFDKWDEAMGKKPFHQCCTCPLM